MQELLLQFRKSNGYGKRLNFLKKDQIITQQSDFLIFVKFLSNNY
jgi:hypothetical protein